MDERSDKKNQLNKFTYQGKKYSKNENTLCKYQFAMEEGKK